MHDINEKFRSVFEDNLKSSLWEETSVGMNDVSDDVFDAIYETFFDSTRNLQYRIEGNIKTIWLSRFKDSR